MRKKINIHGLILLAILICHSAFAELGADWTQATDSANWTARHSHAATVFDGKMWILGGSDSTSLKSDVWYSTDGTSWTATTSSALWTPREDHTAVAFDGKLWVIGGYTTGGAIGDVWSSTNGKDWVQVKSLTSWGKRYDHTSVVFDGKMWVIGGLKTNGTSERMKDVWYSTNGVDWTQATSSALWVGRIDHTSVVFDNKIWVLGGAMYNPSGNDRLNDVWSSQDGASWSEVGYGGWTSRNSHCSAVYDNKIWVFGGNIGGFSPFVNDVWHSTNGADWIEATDSANWSKRWEFASVVFDNKIWVFGGALSVIGPSTVIENDVWWTDIHSSVDNWEMY